MDHSTKKQIGILELRIQELRREKEDLDGANAALKARNEAITTEAKKLAQENEQLKAELEERKAAWEMGSAINERLRAKIDELEERKKAWEADSICLQARFKELEELKKETKFTVCLYVEDEKDFYVERARFTFSDYKSMDDFIQMALIHEEGSLRFVIQKGEN